MFSKKEFAFVSNLIFISRTNFMLSLVEHEISFITLGQAGPFCHDTYSDPVKATKYYQIFSKQIWLSIS